jgi:hypothetical protein
MMRIFRLVEFERDRQLTLAIEHTQAFGHVAVTYALRPVASGSRIFVKLNYRLGARSPMRWLLPTGDLIMMRKQLLTLKQLAEREHRAAAT